MNALVTSYTELIEGIKCRLAELGIRYEDFDTLAGFPDGLTGKAFGPAQVKRLGPEKMFDALRAAALSIRIEPDAEQLAKLQKQIAENCQVRQANQARPNNHASAVSSHVLSRAFGHILRRAREKRWAGTTKAERSEHARMMAMVRHRKDRKRRRVAMQRRQREKAEKVSAAKKQAAAPIHSGQ